MLFNKAKRRAEGVKKDKCPYCGRQTTTTKGYGGAYYHTCRCSLNSYTTKTEYSTNYFDDCGLETEYEKFYTEKLVCTDVKGDWHSMPDDLRNTLKYLDTHGTTVKITPNDPKFTQMISDGKRLINNICPICNGEIKEYSRLVKGVGENVMKIVMTGIAEAALTNEYVSTPDRTVKIYQCPQQHGSYELSENCYYGVYSKRYYLKSVENLTESQMERLYKAAAFSYARARNKYWESPKK